MVVVSFGAKVVVKIAGLVLVVSQMLMEEVSCTFESETHKTIKQQLNLSSSLTNSDKPHKNCVIFLKNALAD